LRRTAGAFRFHSPCYQNAYRCLWFPTLGQGERLRHFFESIIVQCIRPNGRAPSTCSAGTVVSACTATHTRSVCGEVASRSVSRQSEPSPTSGGREILSTPPPKRSGLRSPVLASEVRSRTSYGACCARAASGQVAAAPPSATSNSRRPMVTDIRPSRARVHNRNDTIPRECSLPMAT
jgi:hypothetical protein